MFVRIVVPSYLGSSRPRQIATQEGWTCYTGATVEGGLVGKGWECKLECRLKQNTVLMKKFTRMKGNKSKKMNRNVWCKKGQYWLLVRGMRWHVVLRLPDGTAVVSNVGNCFYSDTVPHHRWFESSEPHCVSQIAVKLSLFLPYCECISFFYTVMAMIIIWLNIYHK